MNIISEIGSNDGGENAGYIRSLMIIKKNDIINLENPVFKANTGLYAIMPSMLTLSDTAEIYKLNF